VWSARDERLERDVAVKILARERILDGRFEREARAAAKLSHPGIVTLYEAAVDDDAAYLVSELVRGATLDQLLEAGRLSDRDIVDVGIALSEALAHAHSQGVVHRDIKPSNVLVPEHPGSPAQVAKLTDFGVARLIGADTLTRTGEIIGTAAYMAPEQADGREAGAVADLYSLALVLYEALTGVNPLALGSPAQRARRLGAHLPPLRRHRRDLPGDLGQALDRALRPRPGERGRVEELRLNLVSSRDQVGDRPGVVAPPWPRRREERRAAAVAHRAPALTPIAPVMLPAMAPAMADAEAAVAVGDGASPAMGQSRWALRLLSALAAAVAAAWLVGLMSWPPRAGPVAAGLLAGIAVGLLPRIGWLSATAILAGLFVVRGAPGDAILLALAALLPVILMPRRGTSWPAAAAAAGLGAFSLAGAWPALAGRSSRAWNRAALGAVGWVWTLFAGALAGHGLYTELPRGLPPGWEKSLAPTVDSVLPRLCSAGLLAPALVWAAGAVVLPWLMARWTPARVVLITVWSAGVASATATAVRLSHSGIGLRPGAIVLGAVLAWLLALGPSFTRWGDRRRQSTDIAPRLA